MTLPEELPGNGSFAEGAKKKIIVNAYERDPKARAACLSKFGCKCSICGVLLEERYGPVATGFIHVHHLSPLALAKRNHRVIPKKDLRPVCPNCHAIIHLRIPPFSIREMKFMTASTYRKPKNQRPFART